MQRRRGVHGIGASPHRVRKRVWAIMHAHSLVLVRDSEPGKTPSWARRGPNPSRRWATDLTTVWTRRDGTVALVPTIDCGCRSILSLVVTKDQHSPAVLISVESALIDAFGSRSRVPTNCEKQSQSGYAATTPSDPIKRSTGRRRPSTESSAARHRSRSPPEPKLACSHQSNPVCASQ